MNRLARATSPYLRQHAANPVDWYEWGGDAFAAARARGVCVLVSIGYSSCHWCHVMAHESFEDEATAAVMNARFVAIKVDREERPDVDALYMEAVQALSGSGGWPLNVFVTPDGRPFFGGTYFPPDARGGTPSFRAVLDAVADAWADRRDELERQAGELTAAVSARLTPPEADDALPGARALVRAATARFGELFDHEHGGIGTAPKFPQAPMLELLLRAHLLGEPGALDMVTTTLLAMASGGIYDQLGGGFCRYSTDRYWLVPHFEKMLYDQAALGRTYLHAYQVTGDDRFAQILAETCAFTLRELSGPGGELYSSLDADSPGGEGLFYTWTPKELVAVLGERDAERAASWYGVRAPGNFAGGRSVLARSVRGDLVRPEGIEALRARLQAARARRPGPERDEKVLTEWNADMGSLFAEAAPVLGDPTLGEAAGAIADFLLTRLRRSDGRLLRSYKDGSARHLATAGDYAATIDLCTRLGELTGSSSRLASGIELAEALVARFSAEGGGFFLTGDDAEHLVVRPRDLYDGVVASSSSRATSALLRLGAITARDDLVAHARRAIARAKSALASAPLALADLAGTYLTDERGVVEVVVGGRRADLLAAVRAAWRPEVVLAWGEPMPTPLWEGRDDARAYVCRDGACLAPVADPQALLDALVAASRSAGQ